MRVRHNKGRYPPLPAMRLPGAAAAAAAAVRRAVRRSLRPRAASCVRLLLLVVATQSVIFLLAMRR